jgi:tRNA G46 methylase TrmB
MDGLISEVNARLESIRYENPLMDIIPSDEQISRMFMDIDENSVPGQKLEDNPFYNIFLHWSIGDRNFPMSREMIARSTNSKETLVSKLYKRWGLSDWDSLARRKYTDNQTYDDSDILEIGCSKGEFALRMVSKNNRVTGIEIDQYMASCAILRRSYFLDPVLRGNVNIHQADFMSFLDAPIGEYDLIFVNFPNPRSVIVNSEAYDFLVCCTQHLKSNGEIRLVTEVDDMFYRFQNHQSLNGTYLISADTTKGLPIDTPTGRYLLSKNKKREFYELAWKRSQDDSNVY